MSVEQTLKERGSRYGDFTDHARLAQGLQFRMQKFCLKADNPDGYVEPWKDRLNDVQRQALTVIADKIARILSGDPDYADNWHDIQGYAKLVEERLPAAQHEQESRVAVAIDKLASDAAYPPQVTMHFGAQPEYPAQHPVCPDCGAPEGDLHYVLCPRLPVPKAHAEAVEAAFAEQVQFDEALTDQQQAKPKGCTKTGCFPYCDCGTIDDYVPPAADTFDEARADIIGQNGNDGEHYEQPVDVNDWRTWQVGDVLEAIVDYQECDGEPPVIREGELVTLLEVEPPAYDADLPVKVQAENGWYGWPDHEDYGEPAGTQRQLFRFHHRPAKTDE